MRASEMKKGQTVKFDDKLYAIVDYQHVKLGKGGAVYQTKIKSLTEGTTQNVRLRAEEILNQGTLRAHWRGQIGEATVAVRGGQVRCQ